tara:strand:+ start:1172 stop:1447 length:276 start_codon:yes stop_codon:yes gene_type:complete
MPKSVIRTHGGAMWDTLFILLKDNDKDFIVNFIQRLPCKDCIDKTMDELNKHNLDNKSKEELYKILWDLRSDLHNKYKDKTLDHYLNYLFY